jgi:phage terminase small subunit
MSLTPQQERFCLEYLQDPNATAAYQRAYPDSSRASAERSGPRLMGNVEVQSRIAALQAERRERAKVTADRVLIELARLAFFDARTLYRPDGTLKDPSEWDDAAAAVVSGIETEEEYEPEGEEQEPQPHGGTLTRHRGRVRLTRTQKVKRFDKNKTLELLCRHLGMFDDKLTVATQPGSGLDISRLPDAVKRSLLDAFRAARAGGREPDRPGGGTGAVGGGDAPAPGVG